MAFKPLKNLDGIIKNYLLEGYILKADGGATNYVHIIPRDKMNEWEVKGHQLSQLRESKIEGVMTYDRPNISKIFEELRNEGYTILKEYVSSGCCQYHTNIYYLAGE